MDDRFNTSSYALDRVGLPVIPSTMLLTILLHFGLEDVSDVLVDPVCPTSSQMV